MKVLILDQFSEMGGAQRCLAELLPSFLESGFDVEAALPGPGPLAEFFSDHGVPVHFVACGPYGHGSKTLRDLLRFVNDYRSASGAIARLASGMDLIYVNGPRLMPAASRGRGDVPILFHSHSRVGGRSVRALVSRALRKANAAVIASSRFVAEPWLQSTANDVKVIYNGTADLGFCPRAAPVARPWTIGIIGRISPEKGQLEFIRTARLLTSSGLHARFVIHGASLWASPDYAESLRSAGAGLDIQWAGSNEDVACTLHALDLLVVPSPGDESTTRVIPEAFSAGTPVVAFPSGGIPEIVRHGETGLLARTVSVDGLADAIRAAVANASSLPRITSTARFEWERAFSLPRYRECMVAAMLAHARGSAVCCY